MTLAEFEECAPYDVLHEVTLTLSRLWEQSSDGGVMVFPTTLMHAPLAPIEYPEA